MRLFKVTTEVLAPCWVITFPICRRCKIHSTSLVHKTYYSSITSPRNTRLKEMNKFSKHQVKIQYYWLHTESKKSNFSYTVETWLLWTLNSINYISGFKNFRALHVILAYEVTTMRLFTVTLVPMQTFTCLHKKI